MLFQCMQCVGNQSLLVQDREFRLEISQHSCERRYGPLGAGSSDQFPKLTIHFKSRNQSLTRPRESLPNRRDRIELMVGPVEAILKLFDRHPARLEHDMFPVVLRPVSIEDPTVLFEAIEQRCTG